MFGFFKSSKSSDVAELVQLGLSNISMDEHCHISELTKPEISTLAKKLTTAWMKSLPKEAINDCHIKVLAAFVLVGEARVYAIELSHTDQAEFYINAAKLVTKGIGLHAASRGLHQSDLILLKSCAELAKGIGLDFYEQLLTVRA